MKTTAPNLIRWTGLSLIVAGIIFAGIQPVHPPDFLASVTTGEWAIIMLLKTAMCLLFLLGLAGLYARQVNLAGWLGLAGFLLFSLFWAFSFAGMFAQAFILPPLAAASPQFVESFLGMFNGEGSEMDLGALPVLYGLAGFGGYILGGLCFGIATFRAGVLPRWAGGLFAFAAVAVLGAEVIPHPLDRLLAMPMGLALAWLGYALWSERRENVSGPLPMRSSPELSHTSAR